MKLGAREALTRLASLATLSRKREKDEKLEPHM